MNNFFGGGGYKILILSMVITGVPYRSRVNIESTKIATSTNNFTYPVEHGVKLLWLLDLLNEEVLYKARESYNNLNK